MANILMLTTPLALYAGSQLVERSKQLDPERVVLYAMRIFGLPVGPPDGEVSAAQAKTIVKEQDYICHYGSGDLHPLRLGRHIDHKIPKSKGGSDHRQNLVASCPKHNRQKGASNYTLFKMRLLVDPELRECGR